MSPGVGPGTLAPMTTARNRPTPSLLIDMATVRYRWSADRRSCALLLATGELVAAVDVEDEREDPRVTAFRALDAALDHGRASRLDGAGRSCSMPVVLYNPFSAEVSVAAVPHTTTVTDGGPLAVAAEGCVVEVYGGRDRRVVIDGRTLRPRELTLTEMTRTRLAHDAA